MKNKTALLLVLTALAVPAQAQTVAQPLAVPITQTAAAPAAPAAPDVTVPLLSPQSQNLVAPLDLAAKQAILIDVPTGAVLYALNADQHMPTSSMSKMLTLYLVFEALKDGKLHLTDKIRISPHAFSQPGSRMFLNAGQEVSVEDLIRGVAIQSGNDAAVALAEALGSGSEPTFVDMMNAKARELGMANSHFVDATGLPDPDHYSTARDLATLALALMRNFPEYYHYFSEIDFTFNGIKQGNRNPLLYRSMGCDGIKTGHTDVGGYGLTTSCVQNGRRLLAVVNGMDSMQARADEPAKLIDYGYREFGDYPIVKAGDVMARAAIWQGQAATVPVIATQDLTISLPRASRDGLKAIVTFDQPLAAPVRKGQQIGTLTVTAPGVADRQISLVAANDVARVGFFARAWDNLKLMLHGK
ncbi:MAG: D-alanyl-D-alanine carboxypeptidase [Alphaproteobacteria bacterium]|nr:D-alanyl-D-alanine carboxypeptidase [Alphaproteobacteria bacterium]